MHVFYIALIHFYCGCRCGGEDKAPRVVHLDKRILDVNSVGEELGIVPEMLLSEAKAIVGSGIFEPFQEEAYIVDRDKWLDVGARFTDVIEPDLPHEAYFDLSMHPRPEQVAEALLSTIRKELGWSVKFGLATGKWIAKLAAEVMDPKAYQLGLCPVEAIEDEHSFLCGIKTGDFSPISLEARRRLDFLGYRTIGEIVKAPLQSLLAHFGEEGRVIYEASRGKALQQVRADYPRDSLSERLSFESPIASLETLELACENLSLKLSKRLIRSDRTAHRIRMWIEFEDGQVLPIIKDFKKPLQSYLSLNLASKQLIENISLDQNISTIRIVLPNLQTTTATQLTLQTTRLAKERIKEADTAFQVINHAFGDGSVQRASDMEIPRRKAVLQAWKRATGWVGV